MTTATASWSRRRADKADRLAGVGGAAGSRVVDSGDMVHVLQSVLRPGDRVALEGDNQKQADFLSRSSPPSIPACARPAPADLVDLAPRSISICSRTASRAGLDFAYAGPQIRARPDAGRRQDGARCDPHVRRAVRAAVRRPDPAGRAAVPPTPPTATGNLYTGPNTEDTPTLVEAAAFRDGIVIAQVNELVDGERSAASRHPRWLGRLRRRPQPYQIEPLFTRDPRADHRGARSSWR